MLIEIDNVKELSSGEPSVDISINSDLLNAIELYIYESHSLFEIYLTFNNNESNEKFSCHMCRLNEILTYLDSVMTEFYKIDDMLVGKRLIYVNLSRINLIKKVNHFTRKPEIEVDFIKGEYVTITSESEMEKLKQAMMNLNTVKKKVRMKQNFKEDIC